MKIEWLVAANCGLNPHDTHDIVTESQVIDQMYSDVIHSGFVSRKLLQVAVNCLCLTSDLPKMFTNGV